MPAAKANDGVFDSLDYKSTLKARMKEMQKTRPSLTWRKLANEIPMQYTYLSKALNNESTHLNEDHLFVICRTLEFFPAETDFLLLQRSHALAKDPERRNYLLGKIREAKSSRKLDATDQILSSSKLNEQIRYLFEPMCPVIHMALELPTFRKDPRRLCGPLGIEVAQLKEFLRILSRNDYIELDEDGLTVRKTLQAKIHFGPDHFLMRYHLSMVKSQMIARLARTPESEKYGFLVTFTMDEKSFAKVKEEFQDFLGRVQKIAASSKDDHVYQMGFDLFKWL